MEILCLAVRLYYLILLLRIILSWVPSLPAPLEPLARFLRGVTDPVLIPLRRVIPPVRMGPGALDLSPLVLFFGISFLLMPLFCR